MSSLSFGSFVRGVGLTGSKHLGGAQWVSICFNVLGGIGLLWITMDYSPICSEKMFRAFVDDLHLKSNMVVLE